MFSNACYKFNPEIKDWKSAGDACNQAGGKLTSIHSQEELDFIVTLVDSSINSGIWIGGERDGNSFRWIDGTSFDFDNWNEDQPDNEYKDTRGYQNCLEILSKRYGFNDYWCEAKKSFICKKQLMGGMYFKIYLDILFQTYGLNRLFVFIHNRKILNIIRCKKAMVALK